MRSHAHALPQVPHPVSRSYSVLSVQSVHIPAKITGDDPVTIHLQAAIDNARDGDVLICMGAGSIGAVPGKIVDLLQNKELLAQQGRAL